MMLIVILFVLYLLYKVYKYYYFKQTTYGTVICCEENSQSFLKEYIVRYMINGEVYTDNYYRKAKEGYSVPIYYHEKEPNKFTLHR